MSGTISLAPHAPRTRPALWLNAAILMVLLYGLAMFAASFVPAGAVAHDLGQFSGGGDASTEIAARFAAIAGRARLAAACLIGLALAAATQRPRLTAFVQPRAAAAGPRPFALSATGAGPRPFVLSATGASPLLTWSALAVTAAGLALRLYYISRPMRHDEAWTYLDYARMPLYAIPVRYSDVNDHVLNTFFIHIATSLFGNAPAIVRLPALLFGLCVIPAGFLLARALHGARAGVIAAALLASSVPLIEFSVNARGYEALTFFFLVTLLAGYTAITARRRAAWAAVIAAGTLGLYTVPTMMIPLAAAFVWFALLAWRQPSPARFPCLIDVIAAGTAIVLCTALLYLPIFIANGPGVLLNSNGIHSSAGYGAALMTLPGYTARILLHWTRGAGPWLGLPLFAFAAASPALARGARVKLALLLLSLAAGGGFQLLLLKDPGPFREWLPLLACLLVMAAIGLDAAIARLQLSNARRNAAACVLALALCGTIAAGTLTSGVILQSDETAYYPPAQAAALALRGSTAADKIGITSVRADEILYYALRDGIVLRPIFTGAHLRYFRRVPSAATQQGALILLIDAPFNHCSAAACAALVGPDMKYTPNIQVVNNTTPALTELRAPLP